MIVRAGDLKDGQYFVTLLTEIAGQRKGSRVNKDGGIPVEMWPEVGSEVRRALHPLVKVRAFAVGSIAA